MAHPPWTLENFPTFEINCRSLSSSSASTRVRVCATWTRGSHFMNVTSIKSPDRLIANLAGMLPALETAYKDIHAHPELSMQEHRTAGIAAKHLQDHGYDVET